MADLLFSGPLFSQRVLVLVSMDVDSLCACKILQVRECSLRLMKRNIKQFILSLQIDDPLILRIS